MTAAGLDILLIEDNHGDVRLIEEMLDDAMGRAATATDTNGASVREFRHAARLDEGIQRLEAEPPDLVLLDLGLPDSTGIATLETVRERSREVPIVVLTGLTDETVGAQAVQQGAQEYLIKDELTPPLLRRSIRHAIERKEFERTQSALHSASRNLIQAESGSEVGELAVDTAVEVLDLQGVSVYLFDDTANVLKPVAYTEYVEEIFGEVPSFGADDSAITWQAFITGETITFEDVLESEHVHREDTPFRSGIWIPLGDHGVLAILAEEIGGLDPQTEQLADHLAATAEAALDRVKREEALREHKRELEVQTGELEDLNRLNALIREIDQALVEATTRDAIEQAVCDTVTQDDRIAFAWIGEQTGDGTISPRTWAGSNDGYLDVVSLETDAAASPAVTAATTESVVVIPNLATDIQQQQWRREALSRGLQSVISLPLRYDDMTYGVLTVFATKPDALGMRSENVAAELGETIANAMSSIETREALLADTVVELELKIHEPDDVLDQLARQAGCRIEYEGVVPQSERASRIFFSTYDASASDIEATAADISRIRQYDRISDDSSGGSDTLRWEMTVAGPTIPSTLVDCGAAVQSIQVENRESQAVVELPNSIDVRTFIDRFGESYPDTELIARRDRERGGDSRQTFEALLTGKLTERQLESLQTAYYNGYFEWPRERTGEEVAESLDISQPTFNAHLRTAERKLCSMLFDDVSAASE